MNIWNLVPPLVHYVKRPWMYWYDTVWLFTEVSGGAGYQMRDDMAYVSTANDACECLVLCEYSKFWIE